MVGRGGEGEGEWWDGRGGGGVSLSAFWTGGD